MIANLFKRKPSLGPSLNELVILVVRAAASLAPAVSALGVLLVNYGDASEARQAIQIALASTALALHACDAMSLVRASQYAGLLRLVASPLLEMRHGHCR
jgi:hypothetical protein